MFEPHEKANIIKGLALLLTSAINSEASHPADGEVFQIANLILKVKDIN